MNKKLIWVFVGQDSENTFIKDEKLKELLDNNRIIFLNRVDNDEFDDFCELIDLSVALPDVSSGGNAIYRSILKEKPALVSYLSDVSKTCLDELVYNDKESFFSLLNTLSSDNNLLESYSNLSSAKLHSLRKGLTSKWSSVINSITKI